MVPPWAPSFAVILMAGIFVASRRAEPGSGRRTVLHVTDDEPAPAAVVTAVVFDVGETLVDETGMWEKPSPSLFARIVEEAGVPAGQIAYVGDRVDNDIGPALAAGMVAVHVRRGPWGHLHEPPREAIRIRSLDELPEVLP